MILQIVTDAGEVMHHLDPEATQMRAWPDARNLQ